MRLDEGCAPVPVQSLRSLEWDFHMIVEEGV